MRVNEQVMRLTDDETFAVLAEAAAQYNVYAEMARSAEVELTPSTDSIDKPDWVHPIGLAFRKARTSMD